MIFPLKTTSIVTRAEMADASLLANIHQRAFARPWTASEFQSLMQDKAVSCFVVRRSNYRIKDRIIGFVLVRVVLDEGEILTIAVDPDYHKTGAGEQLMTELMRKLYADRVAKLFLEVDAGNHPALCLYNKLGFKKVGERKGYYRTGSKEASLALVMQAELAP